MYLPRQLFAHLAATLTLSSLAVAQATSPDQQPDKAGGEIRLSEFTVHESSDNTYIASESVTGTRIATPIKDLPFSISVVTSEFMKDFALFDIAGELTNVASLSGLDTQGNSNIRGLPATFYLRNGFYRLGLVDRVNTDRIEVIKGPNAAIYGATSPAGLINIVTKVPKFSPYQEFTLTGGSNDLARAETNINTPLGTIGGVQLAQLFSARVQNAHADTPYSFQRLRLVDENILAKFPDGSTLNFEVEWSKRKETPSSSTVPFEYNTVTKTYTSIERKDLALFSQDGPNSVQNREMVSYYLTYEKRWNQIWSSRVNGYTYHRHAFNFNNGTSDQFDPSTGNFGRGNVLVDPLNEDGGAAQVDTLADYSLFQGKVKSKTLITLDYSQNWRYRQQRQVNGNLWTINPVSFAAPDYSVPPRSAFDIITRNDKVRWDTRGIFLREQASFLGDRLLTFASIRRDLVTYNLNFGNQYNASGKSVGTVKTAGTVSHYTSSAWSPNFGLNYKATAMLSVYASHSTSFSPNGQVAKLGDPILPNETSVGWDYGIKGSFLHDTLIFTAGGYYIDRAGVKTAIKDPLTGLSETRAAGNWNTRGFEFEGSWAVSGNFILQATYSHVNARITYSGTASDIGQVPQGVPGDQASFLWKYTFRQSRLKGFSWNSRISYLGRSYPNSLASDARRHVSAPGYAILDTGLGYSWRQNKYHVSHGLRLSVKNVLDREYVTPSGNFGIGRGVYLSYSLNH